MKEIKLLTYTGRQISDLENMPRYSKQTVEGLSFWFWKNPNPTPEKISRAFPRTAITKQQIKDFEQKQSRDKVFQESERLFYAKLLESKRTELIDELKKIDTFSLLVRAFRLPKGHSLEHKSKHFFKEMLLEIQRHQYMFSRDQISGPEFLTRKELGAQIRETLASTVDTPLLYILERQFESNVYLFLNFLILIRTVYQLEILAEVPERSFK